MNSPTDLKAIPDVQSTIDARNMPISRVGIKDVRFPLSIDLGAGAQATVARYTMCVYLPADQKDFEKINADISKEGVWPMISKKKDPLPDHEKWAEVKDKRQYLER